MSDPVDDEAPEGFLFELPSELSKAAPPPRPTALQPDAAQEAELARAARVVAATTPTSVQHGRPAGAANALAFHTWGKDTSKDAAGRDTAGRDPSTKGDAPKKPGSR
jgi:hypothetical protein